MRLNIADRRLGRIIEEAAIAMYKSPELKKLGTFREVTKAGVTGPFDNIGQSDGCNVSNTCRTS